MALHLSAAVVSDIGPRRSGNEDAAFVAPFAAAVADGVGGGPAGEIAAAALIHRVASSSRHVESVDRVRSLLRSSNWDIGARVREDPSVAGMATTFTGLFLSGSGLFLAHVGDSRGYLLSDGALVRQTRDDSWVQHLVDSGLISPRDALTHPRRNIVTASFHGDPRDGDALTVTRFEPRAADRWLLCSDGISDYLPHDALQDVLIEHEDPNQAAAALVALAIEAGTHDNVTAVVCDLAYGRGDVEARPLFAGAAADHFAEDVSIA
jgi:PPM family protein phosphatase